MVPNCLERQSWDDANFASGELFLIEWGLTSLPGSTIDGVMDAGNVFAVRRLSGALYYCITVIVVTGSTSHTEGPHWGK